MLHHQSTDQAVVAHQLPLGGAGARVNDALRMRDRDTGRQSGGVLRGATDRPCKLARAGDTFTHDGCRLDVGSQTTKHRMTNVAVAGPVGERHLGHQRGLHPVRAAVDPARIGERADGGGDRGEPALERQQRVCIKAGADPAGVLQHALFVVHAQQQGADAGACALRIGIAADHELLPAAALELDPVGRAARHIG